jgi:hypothetical protein
MVTAPTVLVVGAGGSIPYGFPSGRDLTKEIIALLSDPGTIARQPPGLTLTRLGYPEKDIIKFATELQLSRQNSVDAFLENRAEFVKIGKAAIAAILIPRERQDKLNGTDDWYGYLFNRLLLNLKEGAEAPLTIVTFNYDRSLDYFIYSGFEHSFCLSGAELNRKLFKLKIIHVHGLLCPLPLFAPANVPSRPYINDAGTDAVRVAADCIRIVHEAGDDDAEFVAARQALQNASRIEILGFGYSAENTRRLFGAFLKSTQGILARGSGFGMTRAEQLNIAERFNGRIVIGATEHDCHRFLREFVGLIS